MPKGSITSKARKTHLLISPQTSLTLISLHSDGIRSLISEPTFFNLAFVTPFNWSLLLLLLRAMQTAAGVFGCVDDEVEKEEGSDLPPLMVANAGNSSSPRISSFNCTPFVATELCREHLSLHPCDWRSSITTCRSLFPAIDFSLIESDEDTLVKPGQRETFEEVAARALQFLKWIWTRKEKEIAVVSHGGFLHDMLSLFGNDCHPSVKSEIGTRFDNCQLLSIVLVDRGMIGSDPPATNYSVKVADVVQVPKNIVEKEETVLA
ncbi:Phosphoglycerate mutase-like protein [Linum perenne]